MTNPSQEKTLRDEFAMAAPPIPPELVGRFFQQLIPKRYWGWKNTPESEFVCRAHDNPNPHEDGYEEKNMEVYWQEYDDEKIRSRLLDEIKYRYAYADAMLAERMK